MSILKHVLVPKQLSVPQQKVVTKLRANLGFVDGCGWGGDDEIARIMDIYRTQTYYEIDRVMLNDLHQKAKKFGLIP